ncbi:MAG TPA: MopE-related protein [Chitinophagales bacterium]|nr:MopE-related protein [Chitinophagales bacterium]
MRSLKHILLFTYLSMYVVGAFSQGLEKIWGKSIGGSDNDYLKQIKQTRDGGCVICGYSYSDDFDIPENKGSTDFLLIKMNSSGDIEWIQTYGGSSIDRCYGVDTTLDGGYIMAGYTYSNDFDVTDNLEVSAWVVRVDSIGNIVWQKTYGGSGFDAADAGIISLDDGSFVIAGQSYSNDGDVIGHVGTTDYKDFWVFKIDAVGDIIWSNSYGSTKHDHAYGISKADSGFIVTGVCGGGDGDVTYFKGGFSDFWTIYINDTGELIWQSAQGGSDSDEGVSCAAFGDTAYTTGIILSDDGDVTDHIGDWDAWVTKTYIGSLINAKSFGGHEGDGLFGCTEFQINKIATCGYSESFDGDLTANLGSADFWIAIIDSSLQITSQISLGGSESDKAYSIINTPDNCLLVGGVSNSDDYDVDSNYGLSDIWIVKLAICDNHYFADSDGDGYGNLLSDTLACSAPVGYVADSTDCNDADASQYPSAIDICNAFDDNCNGLIDEDATFNVYYLDFDGDNYGDVSIDSTSCITPPGYVNNSLDCNDADLYINPDAPESCNGIDDNCNALIDDGLIVYTFYIDADGDTFGNPLIVIDTCVEAVPGYVTNDLDCNDLLASIYPGTTEVCNALDDDCNGIIDDNLTFTWLYQDADGDLFGNANIDTLTCMEISGYVLDSTDCNDTNPAVFPGAIELLNGIDDDCDFLADEGLVVQNGSFPNIEIFPNPTNNIFNIGLPSGTFVTISISDINGALIFDQVECSGNTNIFDLTDQPAGIYWVKIICKGWIRMLSVEKI